MAAIGHAYIIYIDNEHSIEYANQCAQSCERFGVPYTLFKGYSDIPNNKLTSITGFNWIIDNAYLDCVNEDETINSDSVNKELNCTASHLKLWELIASRDCACAVFEHDVIVKHQITNIDIPDDQVVMLGYRLLSEDHYNFPNVPIQLHSIQTFQGAHAYALTPTMAKVLLDKLHNEYKQLYGGIDATVDGLISIENNLRINKSVISPPVAIAVVGKRKSTIRELPAKYNVSETQGFVDGLTREGLSTFKIAARYDTFNDGVREYIQVTDIPNYIDNHTPWSLNNNYLTALYG